MERRLSFRNMITKAGVALAFSAALLVSPMNSFRDRSLVENAYAKPKIVRLSCHDLDAYKGETLTGIIKALTSRYPDFRATVDVRIRDGRASSLEIETTSQIPNKVKRELRRRILEELASIRFTEAGEDECLSLKIEVGKPDSKPEPPFRGPTAAA